MCWTPRKGREELHPWDLWCRWALVGSGHWDLWCRWAQLRALGAERAVGWLV